MQILKTLYIHVQYEMSIGHMTVHWIQWTTQMSIGHVHVQWTYRISIGYLSVNWIFECQLTKPDFVTTGKGHCGYIE
jgi:uncharacterized membrane protein